MSHQFNEAETRALVQFSFLKGLGVKGQRTLASLITNPFDLLEGHFNFNIIEGISPQYLKGVYQPANIGRAMDLGDEQMDFCLKNEIQIWHPQHPDYPYRLKYIPDAPFILYFKGNPKVFQRKILGVVGTRNESDYGKLFSRQLFEGLTPFKHQLMLLSGLAFGVDISAHKNALKAGIPTVAVVAHGHHTIYPAAHKDIAQEMIFQGGGILSEFSIFHKPDRENFPKRNRIVAGLIHSLVVVESALKGGSMITAQLANDYNRDVLALPGRISDPWSKGCNALIQSNRAHCVSDVRDVVEFLGLKTERDQKPVAVQLPLFTDLSKEEASVIELLQNNGSMGLDDMAAQLNWQIPQLNTTLFQLEMAQLIIQKPGKMVQLS